MSGDSSMPDFDDLLAAFDIPDVTVRIREATAEDEPSSSAVVGEGENGESAKKTTADDDSTSNNDSVDRDSSIVQSNSIEEKSSGTSAREKQDTIETNGEDSNKSQEAAQKTNQENNVSETNDVVVPVSINRAPAVRITMPKQQHQKTGRNDDPQKAGNKTAPPKIVLISSPQTTPGFKNTSSDGPKILNVTGGGSNIIRIPSTGTSGKPAMIKHIITRNVTHGTMKVISSNMLGSQAFKPAVVSIQGSKMPYYKISGVPVVKPSSVPVTVNHLNITDQTVKNLSFQQLARKNPIDTYTMTPPPEELGIQIPVGGYQCKECGDSYALEESLKRHMERKSVKIVINCSFCKHTREFYNKCSMHAHIRSHNFTNMNSTIDAVVSPLDAISTGGAGRPKVNASRPTASNGNQKPDGGTDVNNLLQQARQKLTDNLKKPSSAGVVQEKSTSNLKLDLTDPSRCPLCSATLNDQVENPLRHHLQTRKEQDQAHSCLHCGMMAINFCQLMLHNLLHFQAPNQAPWLCPECGIKFTHLSPFLQHVSQVCLHFSRTAMFACQLCAKSHFAAETYTMHLSSVHKNSFYKCVKCHLAFRSVDSVKGHALREHNYMGKTLCSIISKCPLCDTVFTIASMLESHLKGHIRTSPPIGFQFSCKLCAFKSTASIDVQAHIKTIHSNKHWWICDICHHIFRSFKTVLDHRRELHKKYFTPGEDPKCTLGMTQVDATKSKSLPNGKTVEDKQADKDKKESTKVIIKRMLRCPGCKALGTDHYFKKEKNLRSHISRHHSHMDPNEIRPEFVEYVPFYPGKGNSDANDRVGHKRKRSIESGAAAERIKRLKEDKLFCGKCKFETKDRISFSSHIQEHRDDGDASQCQECGVCFRVADSLHKHLFIKHQIRDVEAYHKFQSEVQESIKTFKAAKIQEMSQSEKASPQESPANPLECSVCHRMFDTEALKKNHMRSHGMAFIGAKNKAT